MTSMPWNRLTSISPASEPIVPTDTSTDPRIVELDGWEQAIAEQREKHLALLASEATSPPTRVLRSQVEAVCALLGLDPATIHAIRIEGDCLSVYGREGETADLLVPIVGVGAHPERIAAAKQLRADIEADRHPAIPA